MFRLPIGFAPWLAALVSVAVYLPAQLSLGYVWDDWHLFLDNPSLRMPETAWGALFQPVLPGSPYFRPLPLATLAAEFLSVGVQGSVSHAVNLIFHAINTLLVGLIAQQLTANLSEGKHVWRVLLPALLYAIHPALIEPVAWVAGRFDLMVTCFMLAAIWGYLTFAGKLCLLWVSLFFLIAALSKEMAVVLPLILGLLYLIRQGAHTPWLVVWQNFWRSGEWRLYAGVFIAGLFYLALRAALLPSAPYYDDGVVSLFDGVLHHLAFVGQTLLFYLKMALWPFTDLSPLHPLLPSDMNWFMRLSGLLAILSSLLLLVVALRSRRPFLLLITGFLLALLPVLNIIPLSIGGNLGNERFLTFPIAILALSLAFAPIPDRVSPSMQRMVPVFLAGIVLFWLGLAVANVRLTVPLWTNDLSLWSWVYARHPDFADVRFSYAASAIRYRQLEKAGVALANVTLEQRTFANKHEVYLVALKGQYMARSGHPREALDYYRYAEAATPFLAHRAVMEKSIEIDSAHISHGDADQWFLQFLYVGMAEAYNALGEFEKSLEMTDIARFYTPNYPPAWLARALALYGLDRPVEADKTYARALEYYLPDNRHETEDLRRQFMEQLCSGVVGPTPSQSCARWTSISATPDACLE